MVLLVGLSSREPPLAQVQVPLGVGGPGDQLAGFDHLAELDDRLDVPVREVADPDDALLGGALRLDQLPHRSALERVDAVCSAWRRPARGSVVAHRDVDPGVVQLTTARVEPRAAHRVLPVPRGDRPAAIVVGVPGPQLAPTGDGITSSGRTGEAMCGIDATLLVSGDSMRT